MKESDYETIRRLVYEHSRINLGPHKKELVTARLTKRIRALRLPTLESYCEWIRTPQGQEEIDDLIDVISTNHTHFFREPSHFQFMFDQALPQIIQKAPKRAEKLIRVWSAACSSGEEPYTIAIVLEEFLKAHPGWRWEIVATDISQPVLRKAVRRVYMPESVDKVPSAYRQKYFELVLENGEKRYRVVDSLAAHIQFHRINLLGSSYSARTPFDIIFCRNVMIYFDAPTQEQLIGKLSRLLAPQGYLMIGHSENLTAGKHNFRLICPAVYQLK